jgi:Ni,Fe-hydrogenase III large subunit
VIGTDAGVEGASAFCRRVVAECKSSTPAGAYADADAAHYVFLDERGPHAVSHALDRARHLCSVSPEFPLFSWDEREMAQEWDVRFYALPDDRPIRASDGKMPPALVAQGEGIMQFVVGPVHAGVIEPGRFTISSGGETVVRLDAQLGYAHRAVERKLQGVPTVGAASMVARICGGCSASRSYAYALAIEDLAAFRPEPEIDLVRMIAAELERIYNHLADLAASASGAGYAVGFARGMALKEKAMRLAHAAFGHRLLFDAIVPGGVGGMPLNDRGRVRSELSELERDVDAYAAALFANASLVSRWERAGVVSYETARAFGVVGPAFRASSGSVDIRSLAPYGAYKWIAPSVPREESGDVFARCRVKREETRESFRLMQRALGDLGDAAVPPQRALEPAAGVVLKAVEGPRGTELLAVHVDDRQRLERIHVISASYRNWPAVALAMEGNIVPDFPLVNKSFNLCYACVDR